MIYFSGFCFKDEKDIFDKFLENGEYIVAGFSYGATKAIEYVLDTDERIDKIQLFSPAFFNDKDEKFIRVQVINFRSNKDKYIENFIDNMSDDKSIKLDKYFCEGSLEELKELLSYKYSEEKLKKLINKGVVLEVFLGADDKIIETKIAKEFFEKFATVYMIKDVGHILR